MRVVALIAAFNEADTVAAVVNGVRPLVNHVLVVDDGSSDATAERARAAGADVILHGRNLGKGQAVRTGLAKVLAGAFTHVLLLDADMQHVPAEASRLLEVAEASGADVVIGARQFDRSEMPPSRYHTNRIGSWALSTFVGVPIPDTQCGYRVFRVDALTPIRLRATGYDIETEMLIKVRRRGGSVRSAPVTAVYGGGRSKLRPIRDTTRTCFRAVYYRFIERL